MSRHHPYGGYDAPARRGGPGPGPGGPDRSFRHERGRGRGGGGGRGGAAPISGRGSYGEAPPYANGYGAHVQGNGYDDAPHYAPEPHSAGGYYNEYGGGHAPAPAPAPSHESYDYHQENHAYEDGSSRGGPPARRRPPRERDDHVHETLIEDRINRERPCRTLFIRNIKYETSSEDVRRRFEEFGEIKSFYDLVSSRGMVFVTYFDLRAAERARERLQNTEIAGRPIDVHYSLPRADEQNGRCDRDKNQGTLHLRLRNSPSGMPLDDHEVRRKFQQFGDVKGVRPSGGPMERLVEMYDTRACEAAHDKLRDQALQDGEMEINFAWDIPEQPLPGGPVPQRQRYDDAPREDFGGGGDGRGRRGGDRGRGGRGGGGGRSDRGGGGGRGGRGGYRDDRDRGDYGHDDWDRGPPPPADNYGRGPPPGPPGAPMYGVPPQIPPQQHIPPPPVQGYAPPAPQAAAPDDRLEQARKVQALLAALKNPAAPPAATPPPPAPPVNAYYTPPGAGMTAPAAAPASYSPYGQPPVAPPVAAPYYPPPPAAVAQPAQPAAAVSALPANLLSFLQQQQSPATPPPPAATSDPRLAAMQMPVSPTQTAANPQAAALSNILGQLAMFGKRP